MERGATTIETVLAFAFGLLVSGVLAYAGLSHLEIQAPNFFFLRLLAALGAGGIAAVIPGFLDLDVSWTSQFALRAGGGLGAFALVYLVNPPELIHPPDTHIQEESMISDYTAGLYNDAARDANEVLRLDPKDARALDILGGVCFYRQDWRGAVEKFQQAVNEKPTDAQYKSNLANALIELGAYQRAIDIFATIDDGNEDWFFAMGRAQFYNGDLASAIQNLKVVRTGYWHGAARILEAATLKSMADNENQAKGRASLLHEATSQFREGFESDPNYWRGIFLGTSNDIHLSYSKPREVLRTISTVFVK